MNIGAAAKASGVKTKMISYYEQIGLLQPAARRANTYRDYGAKEVHELRFIGRARLLGFSVDEIGGLLSLWRDRGRPSRDVHLIAAKHLADLEQRIVELQEMAGTLRQLVAACPGELSA